MVFSTYIDYINIDDPLKIGIDDHFRVLIEFDRITDTRLFIKENTYSIDNSYMYINQLGGKFYTIDTITTQYTKYQDRSLLASFSFWQDSKTTNYDIKVYSILDLFSTIGGIYEMVNVILSMIFGYVSRKMFLFNILDQVSKDEVELNQQFELKKLQPVQKPHLTQNSQIEENKQQVSKLHLSL